jgi:hypothetical protein
MDIYYEYLARYNFKLIPKEKITYKMYEIACNYNGHNLKNIPKKIIDYNLCKIALKNNNFSLKYIPERLINYNLLNIKNNFYLDYNLFEDSGNNYDKYKNNYIKKVKKIIKEFSLEKKYTYEIYKKFFIFNNNLFLKNKNKLRDLKIYLSICSEKKYIKKNIIKKIKKRKYILSIIKSNKSALYYVPKDIIDYSLCKIASKYNNNNTVLEIIPDKYKDYNMCLINIKNNIKNIYYIPTKFKNDNIFLKIKIPDYLENNKSNKLFKDKINNNNKFFDCSIKYL